MHVENAGLGVEGGKVAKNFEDRDRVKARKRVYSGLLWE